MKSTSVGAQARKKMARERDRILRIRREAPSPLKKETLAWERKKEVEERKKQREKSHKEAEQSFNFQKFLAPKRASHDKEKLIEETGWTQYKLRQEGESSKKQLSLNMSTIRGLARRLIAKEWARVLGKTQNYDLDSLDREASSLKERKEEEERKKEEVRLKKERRKKILKGILKMRKKEEKRRKEEIMLKMDRQKKIFKEALYEFGQKLRQEKDTLKPEKAAALLEETLESVGEIFSIEWHKQGCFIWFEPWEEEKIRRISGDSLPVIYKAKINRNFYLASYKQVDDESIRLKMREQRLSKILQGFSVKDEEEAEEVLEKALSKIGRIIDLKRAKNRWDAFIEPWEEVRLRNIKNKGKGSVAGAKIEINWSKGKFSFGDR